jgi:hypothetical protein
MYMVKPMKRAAKTGWSTAGYDDALVRVKVREYPNSNLLATYNDRSKT